jgi:hypothetical protein
MYLKIKSGKCHNISVRKEFSLYFNGWKKRFTDCEDFSTDSVILAKYSIKTH